MEWFSGSKKIRFKEPSDKIIIIIIIEQINKTKKLK
jgi:hypothetical protein